MITCCPVQMEILPHDWQLVLSLCALWGGGCWGEGTLPQLEPCACLSWLKHSSWGEASFTICNVISQVPSYVHDSAVLKISWFDGLVAPTSLRVSEM